ncbi:DUF2459 domain-containing protein [Bosea sp. 685]|uniref:DUF2459 domain-containing protein n=1 Tax=Bosea sp. 685 TaxID=3080057 RepID=UPI00289344B2|nr:DUF2459 domain-containing protein [Bosea sp. 685]WNJ90914.1 DUF2459 domain-containing protein [Bosea sp. 685]
MNTPLRAVRNLLLGLLALMLAAGLALFLGALPYGSGAQPPPGDAVTIHVATNGFHTDILVPSVTATRDWRPLLEASPITRASADAPMIAFGWGSQSAYTELGAITDLSPRLLLKAAAFDASVVHVRPVAALRAGPNLVSLTITQAGYQALVDHIEQSLQYGPSGAPIVLDGLTHGLGDAFLRGRDRFWLLRSCNVWVGEGLRKAGLPVGLWTPLAQSLMWSLSWNAPVAARP